MLSKLKLGPLYLCLFVNFLRYFNLKKNDHIIQNLNRYAENDNEQTQKMFLPNFEFDHS